MVVNTAIGTVLVFQWRCGLVLIVVDIANNKKHSVRVKKSNVKKSLPMARDASQALEYFCWCWVSSPSDLLRGQFVCWDKLR
jgi:hypothetical protein